MDQKIIPAWLDIPHAIPFDAYMHQVLYHPVYGYYQQASSPLGRDFQTAPMISSGLGYALAYSIASAFTQPYDLYELGPGDGHLCLAVLETLKRINHLPQHVFLHDASPERAQTAAKKIAHIHKAHILSEPPASWSGALIANEYLDAIPFKRFSFNGNQHYEHHVVIKNNHLAFDLTPAISPYNHEFISPMSYEYCSYEPFLPWLLRGHGTMWLIDYGYDQNTYLHPDRTSGTMQCFYEGHKHDDPLANPGRQDITSHVNFSHVAQIVSEHRFLLHGFNSQGRFMQEVLQAHPNYPYDKQPLKTLMHPHEMGETIKVLVCGTTSSSILGTSHKMPLRC